ncbi:MAG: alpha/beta fold hydrolase [Flavobacteriales bacterium]|nr:alpha/beta fold hydrolase [Flavobacteriales bacterium]
MGWFIGFLSVVVLAYAGICLFYFIFQERFIFIGFRKSDRYRFRFERPFEEVWLDRPDGARLHAVRFMADAPCKGRLVYFHGHHGSVQRWGRSAERFLRQGYDVLMPDPRGYGKSRGRRTERHLIDDALAWYDRALESGGGPVVLYGRSLGSGLAVPVAAGRAPAMLLLETPFANLIDVAWNYLPFLPYRLLLRYMFRNDQAMRGVRCPVHIFHGRRDQVVPYASALRLYAAIPSDVERAFHDFPQGRHSNLLRFARFRRVQRRLLADLGAR